MATPGSIVWLDIWFRTKTGPGSKGSCDFAESTAFMQREVFDGLEHFLTN